MNNHATILTDSFGRVHDYLRISLTERCNLRCTYCMPEEGIPLREKSHFMTIEEIVDIAKVFVGMGIKKIRLTGGEPLVRKNVEQVILQLAQLPVRLALTTNGILVNQHIETLRQANLQSINVSIDSLRKERMEKITRRDHYYEILHNIALLEKEGFPLKLNAVLMKGFNDDEIVDFVELTRHKSISVRFIEFMPFLGNNWNRTKGVSFEEILQTLRLHYGTEPQKLPEKANDTARNFYMPGFKGSFGIISSVTNPFCATCNRIRLTADGKIKNCLFSGTETDILTPYRNGESLELLIREAILHKKAVRGGMDSDTKLDDATLNQRNRSMISIGG